MAAAGVALLVLALALEAQSRPGSVRTRTRSVLVGALLMTAGLALLLVRRLDPAALSRVLARDGGGVRRSRGGARTAMADHVRPTRLPARSPTSQCFVLTARPTPIEGAVVTV